MNNSFIEYEYSQCTLEAIVWGIQVLATEVGDIPEDVLRGHNGLLVPAGDADAFASEIFEI